MLQRLLFIIGIVCLGLYVTFSVQAWRHQHELERQFERELFKAKPEAKSPLPRKKMTEGELVGRLEIPRLNMSVMVMEGIADHTLRLGAGRIPGTALPWATGNIGIAAHRDTYFRGLEKIRKDDTIRFSTVDGLKSYRVTSTTIVKPDEVKVLQPTKDDTITLVTCYPFYYVGPAPKRFIVQATKQDGRTVTGTLSNF